MSFFQRSIQISNLLYIGAGIGIPYLWYKANKLTDYDSDDEIYDKDYLNNNFVTNKYCGNRDNIYLSFDIEADGPSPSVNSMVSIGIYGFNGVGDEVVSYQRNIKPCSNRIVDIPTKERFWDKNPDALNFVQTDQVSAEECMSEISDLYKGLKEKNYKIVWVARPSAFDWQWLNCYYNEFGPDDKPNIGFSASCISTAFWIYCQQNKLSKEQQKELWKELKGDEDVTHNPLDDARCQGKIMFKLMDKFKIRL